MQSANFQRNTRTGFDVSGMVLSPKDDDPECHPRRPGMPNKIRRNSQNG